jgi:hypothetical protein
MNPRRFALRAALAATLFAACSAPRPHAEVRAELDHAWTLVSKGELAIAERLLERSLAEPGDDGSRWQRFQTAVLLVRTHVAAAFGAPYLPSSRLPRGAEWNLDGQAAAPLPSPLAHCVAALRWVELARACSADVREPSADEARDLLPAPLDGATRRDSLAYVQLAALACYSRLRFDNRVEEILAGMSELADLDRCDAALAAARIEDGARPWIYSGAFAHLVVRDEPRAFKFAVRALETSGPAQALGARERERIVQWIRTGSRFAFRCPTCKTLADPELFACTVCRRPTLEFEPEPREISR